MTQKKKPRCTVDISIILLRKADFPGQSCYSEQPQSLLPYQELFLYKWSSSTCACVNVVKEEHLFVDRSMTLSFLIGLRMVTDKNRLL